MRKREACPLKRLRRMLSAAQTSVGTDVVLKDLELIQEEGHDILLLSAGHVPL